MHLCASWKPVHSSHIGHPAATHCMCLPAFQTAPWQPAYRLAPVNSANAVLQRSFRSMCFTLHWSVDISGSRLMQCCRHGLPDETCQNYEAVDGQCLPYGTCENCFPSDGPELQVTAWNAAEQTHCRKLVSSPAFVFCHVVL